MIIDLQTLSPAQVYFTMIQTIIPRPIAWVLSENDDTSYNLAPFSYFNAICSDPPLVIISIGKKEDGSAKDTRVNIEARSDFVVHIAHREMAHDLTQSSASLPYGDSEVTELSLALSKFESSRLPRLADARVAMACSLEKSEEIGNANQWLLYGRVSQIYIDDSTLVHDHQDRQKIAADKIDPLGRLGGGEYMGMGEMINIPRPK